MRERREWRERSERSEREERGKRKGREGEGGEKEERKGEKKWTVCVSGFFNFKPTLGSSIYWFPGKKFITHINCCFQLSWNWLSLLKVATSIWLRPSINPLEHGQGYFPKTSRITSTRPCECVCACWVSEISNVWLHVCKYIIVWVCENVIMVTVLCVGLWISLCSCVWLFNVRKWVFMPWIASA